MPIQKIEVSEYQCAYCGYKWINRVNGKDGPLPERCAKCKRAYWNEGKRPKKDFISPYEKGLRKRIKGLRKLYYDNLRWDRENVWTDFATNKWPEDLAEKFLNLQPRPTIEELKQVVYPKGLALAPLDSQNQYRLRGYVPDPDKPGWLKYDKEEYYRLRRQEALKRLEAMQQIIQSRSNQT